MSGSSDGGERTLIAHTIAPLLQGLGHTLTYWPLTAPRPFIPDGMGDVIDPPRGQGPMARIQFVGQLRRGLGLFDAIVVEQDLAAEFAVAEAVLTSRHRPALYLLAHYPLGYYLAARGEHNIGRERRLSERLLSRFDQIIVLAPSVGADLHERFGVPEERIRSLLWPAPARASARPAAGPAIAVVGHVTRLKGIDVLLHTVKDMGAVSESAGTPELHVFGDGDAVGDAREEAGRLGVRLQFHPLTDHIARDLAGTAQLFYGPQWIDGTAFDYVAAAAAGLPLLGLQAPTAPAEILVSGTMGRLAGLGEASRSGAHLLEFMTDPRVYQGFQQAANLVYSRHRPDRVAPEWAAAFPL